MKLTPFKQLLTMTKEAVDVALAPVRAASAKKRAELEMLKLDEKLATMEMELNTICTTREPDFEKIINKLDEMALTERRKKQFEKIVAEMFPD